MFNVNKRILENYFQRMKIPTLSLFRWETEAQRGNTCPKSQLANERARTQIKLGLSFNHNPKLPLCSRLFQEVTIYEEASPSYWPWCTYVHSWLSQGGCHWDLWVEGWDPIAGICALGCGTQGSLDFRLSGELTIQEHMGTHLYLPEGWNLLELLHVVKEANGYF